MGVSDAYVSVDSNPYPGTVAYRVCGARVTLWVGVTEPLPINAPPAGTTLLTDDSDTITLTDDTGTVLLTPS